MKMGLLKSINNVPGVDYYEYRDSQYYNKYEYRLRARIPCVRYTWYCKTEDDLDRKINGKWGGYGNVRKEDKQKVIDNTPALKAIIKWQKEKKQKQIGIRIESEVIAIFSNNLDTLKEFEKEIGSQYNCDYTQAQTSEYAGIKHFVNDPPHKYRVYLKSKRVGDNFHIQLRQTIEKQPSLHPSPALQRWMYNDGKRYGIWYFRWASSAHFIDYDDESTLSYLALLYGDILGKKYKLEKRPDNI